MTSTSIKSALNKVSLRDIGMCLTGNALRCKRWPALFLVFVLTLFFTWGCGVLKPIDNKSLADGASYQDKALEAVYHDFDDILIPKVMQVNRKMSSVFETPTITAGVLSFEGTLNPIELIEFFKTNMAKDNWTIVGMFKSLRSILQFEKGNRWCMITLTDSPRGYKTQVEIWVTPRNDAAASGLLK